MNVKDFLNIVSYIAPSDSANDDGQIYKSKFDNSYITGVGMEKNVKHLAEMEITEELTHGVGFSPKDSKWYGWSHRAMYGFEIGSTCKKGDCHYKGLNLKEQEEAAINFWTSPHHVKTYSDGVMEKDGEKYFDIKWLYNNTVPNKSLHYTIDGCLHHIKPLGNGEWTAKSMGDAKQMAIDFNEGVS